MEDSNTMTIAQTSRARPIVFIACQVVQDMLEGLLPKGLAERVIYMDYGLHRTPSSMKPVLQDEIDNLQEPSLVVMGYGLCGNGIVGIEAGEHTLLIPRVDDCIAILLGSYQAYIREFEAVPGTYYLSKGWLESGSHPLKEFEEYVEKYGEKSAAWVMDQQYQNYKRLVMVAHSQDDMETYRSEALEVARYCEQWGMRYEEIMGSNLYVRRLVEVAAALEEADDEFVVVSPGGRINLEQFMRLRAAGKDIKEPVQALGR